LLLFVRRFFEQTEGANAARRRERARRCEVARVAGEARTGDCSSGKRRRAQAGSSLRQRRRAQATLTRPGAQARERWGRAAAFAGLRSSRPKRVQQRPRWSNRAAQHAQQAAHARPSCEAARGQAEQAEGARPGEWSRLCLCTRQHQEMGCSPSHSELIIFLFLFIFCTCLD